MKEPIDILKQYWGYETFREPQEAIIRSTLEGKDTLALLPTGGGKSICFQVPAMAKQGICIVVSPLIALMKDQVAHLNERGIKAFSVSSELEPKQLDNLFDRCIYDPEIKFLYLSPERLKTDLAIQRIKQMPVNLIAVDEAHCISEWGYDFRPSYLDIASLRELIPDVPILALTASATPRVVKDIQERLGFMAENVMRKSFFRENLSYYIEWCEDKLGKIERIAKKQGGSGIIYMRSRKGTERLSRALNERGLKTISYHAGLTTDVRTERQEAWMSGSTPVIVATNAFGMGIDKPDVRFVVHCDLPDTLENYYQECGRAGRDGKKAFAVALLTKEDVVQFEEKTSKAFPDRSTVKEVYKSLGSHFQLAVGSGLGETFVLDLPKLSEQTSISTQSIIQSIKLLEREGLLLLLERDYTPPSVMMIASASAIRKLGSSESTAGRVINTLLRSYPRLFEETSTINVWNMTKRLGLDKKEVESALDWLESCGYIQYNRGSSLPRLVFVKERIAASNVRLSKEHYDLRKKVLEEKSQAMKDYVNSTHKCRSRLLLEYFGETDAYACGICDVCTSTQ